MTLAEQTVARCGNCPHDPDAHSPVNSELCAIRDCPCPGLLTVTQRGVRYLDLDDPATVERLAGALHEAIVGCRYDTEHETYMDPCPSSRHSMAARDVLLALREGAPK